MKIFLATNYIYIYCVYEDLLKKVKIMYQGKDNSELLNDIIVVKEFPRAFVN